MTLPIIVVRCNNCMFMQTGNEEEIEIFGREKCPICGKDDYLMDMDISDIVLQNNIQYGMWKEDYGIKKEEN